MPFGLFSDEEWEVVLRAELDRHRGDQRGFTVWIEDSDLKIVERRSTAVVDKLREAGWEAHIPTAEANGRDGWYAVVHVTPDRFSDG